ncbi:MSHA operon transcriptional regulator [Vibrio mimicus]|uniref:Uncharacterized protein n=1 Tax=Vibrio mimicus TaxID=674 RepID=A0A2J9V3A4_VIBMI|nr:hypothetical protein [Vibrio mimicus]EEW10866.1 conserved hypothetical protein [Vibrio mimicus VM573]KFE30120.1 hypothetical protein DN31_3109 [Vibrio mimicus]PNM58225.1 hypothetical protein AL544_020300 [Vibrio mimicus]
MEQDKFTHIFRLPGSIQVRIAKWQQTFRGKSDLVLHQALVARNRQYKNADFQPKGWCVNLFDPDDISITHHGDYIQTAMRTMIDRKVSYKRIYLSRMPLEQATDELRRFKLAWIKKHNIIAQRFNQIQKEAFLNYAREEIETLYPAIPEQSFDRSLWNRLVKQEFGHADNFEDPYFVVKKAKAQPSQSERNRSKHAEGRKPPRRFQPKRFEARNVSH